MFVIGLDYPFIYCKYFMINHLACQYIRKTQLMLKDQGFPSLLEYICTHLR